MKRAFAHLNLTRNPFGEPAGDERADLAVVELDECARWLREPGTYVEFTGRRGRGKSTRLHVLEALFPGAARVRMPEDLDAARAIRLPSVAVVLVDDAQFLDETQREALFQRAGSVAAATHDSLVPWAKLAGFDVFEVEVCGLGPERLREIVDRRLAWARRETGPVPTVTDHAITALIDRFGDDLRTIEDVLYSVFQGLDAGDDVGVGHIEDTEPPTFSQP